MAENDETEYTESDKDYIISDYKRILNERNNLDEMNKAQAETIHELTQQLSNTEQSARIYETLYKEERRLRIAARDEHTKAERLMLIGAALANPNIVDTRDSHRSIYEAITTADVIIRELEEQAKDKEWNDQYSIGQDLYADWTGNSSGA